MLKRTKGRLLLALLVVTGMAGTLKNSTLSQQERKFCVNTLKETRSELVKSVKELSPAQLDFRPAAGKWNIRECLYHIALSEKMFSEQLQTAMKEPANPEKRSAIKFTDSEFMQMAANRQQPATAPASLQPGKATWKSADDALNAFKSDRSEHIKYIKNTTEDLRNHVTELSPGAIDCYQLVLFMTAHSERHLKQIREIMASDAFPKK